MNNMTTNAMLAKKTSFDDLSHTCHIFVQPKLNGIRAIWDTQRKKLITRNGLSIDSVDHIEQQILSSGISNLPLDGEIYTDNATFQTINGLARRNESSEETSILEYHVFDMAFTGMKTTQRLAIVKSIKETHHIKHVETGELSRKSTIEAYYREFILEGYEGIIIRDPDSYYMEGRSSNLLKIKPEHDIEAALTGFEPASPGSRHNDTFGSLILQLANGIEFKCSGLSNSDRSRLWKTKPIGSQITITYGALSDDGVPVFPRFKSIRWDLAA